MRKATKLFFIGILSVIVLVHCEEENNEVGETLPEALQDLQTEFWLPYSVTEDVDFSIVRPEAYGCYQWYVLNYILIIYQPLNKYYSDCPCTQEDQYCFFFFSGV